LYVKETQKPLLATTSPESPHQYKRQLRLRQL
jgi:hypothetical protein